MTKRKSKWQNSSPKDKTQVKMTKRDMYVFDTPYCWYVCLWNTLLLICVSLDHPTVNICAFGTLNCRYMCIWDTQLSIYVHLRHPTVDMCVFGTPYCRYVGLSNIQLWIYVPLEHPSVDVCVNRTPSCRRMCRDIHVSKAQQQLHLLVVYPALFSESWKFTSGKLVASEVVHPAFFYLQMRLHISMKECQSVRRSMPWLFHWSERQLPVLPLPNNSCIFWSYIWPCFMLV